MKRILVVLAMFLATFAVTCSADTTAQELRTNCIQLIISEDKPSFDTYDQAVKSHQCLGYVIGVAEEMTGELVWEGPGSTKIMIGNWQKDATFIQIVKVFVAFVDAHPEFLDKPAVLVIRLSAQVADLYQLKAARQAPVKGILL